MNKVKRLHSAPKLCGSRIHCFSTFFTVEHYAGVVDYDAVGFLVKNKDTLFPDMLEVVKVPRIPHSGAR